MSDTLRVPFSVATGDMLSWAVENDPGVFWMDTDTPFAANLQFKSTSRGRSSVKFHFECTLTSRKYQMFLKDFEQVVPHLIHGELSGMFMFTKRGANYGCKRVGDLP